jgi:WD40 repeat protein
MSGLAGFSQPVSFHSQIRPILARHCQGCHQPAAKQSELVVTSYAEFLKGGRKGAAFVPGKPDESKVIAYLTGQEKPQMPFGAKPLADAEIELFRQWIREGARDDSPAEDAVPTRPAVYTAPPLVTALAYSPDGRFIAVSGYHEILLLNPEGKLEARLPGRSMRIHSLVFSADGATLVSAGGDPSRMGEVQIWDVAGRRLRHSVQLTNDTLYGASLSPDAKTLAVAGTDKSVRLVDVATGKEIRKLDFHEDWVFGTVFGIDGKRLVSVGRDRAAKLISVADGQFLENVNLLKEPLTAVARHPKRDWIVIGGQERIPYLYRMDRPRAMRIADDSTLIRKFAQQDGPILAVAISPDGQHVAVASEIGDVRIYNAETGDLAGRCSGHQGGTYTVQFSADGKRLAAAGFDGTVRVYELNGKLERAFVPAPVERAQR